MEKYKILLNKKINLCHINTIINSYKITEMLPTDKSIDGRGKLYKCSMDWKNKNIAGAYPSLDFDEKTLNDLLTTNKTCSPFTDTIFYQIDKK